MISPTEWSLEWDRLSREIYTERPYWETQNIDNKIFWEVITAKMSVGLLEHSLSMHSTFDSHYLLIVKKELKKRSTPLGRVLYEKL